MAPPPRPRRRPLLGNIPEPDELGIPLDLEEAVARLRAQPIVEDPYQFPPRPAPPAPKPEPPGYTETLLRQMRGEAPTMGTTTGAAGGAAAVGADPEGRRRGILERAFAAADEGAFTGGPTEKGVARYEKEHEDFNRSLEVGARVAREKGGEEAAEQYVYNLHRNQFGGRVADALKASRDHSRRRLAEGSPTEQAAAEGEELARRHLENLKRAAEAGELGEEADTAQRAIDMLSESLGSPKGIARLAVTTGLPMLATAAGTILGTPVIGAGAGVAARTAATRFWREKVEGQGPDPMADLTAGVTELLDVPGIAGLRAVGGAIRNPLLRTAALTAGGAAAEGAQEGAQAVTEGLLQSGDIPRGLDIAAQGLAGALVGGALGPLVGGRPAPGQPPAPGMPTAPPGVAPGAPPGAPGAPAGPALPPDLVDYLGVLGYDVSGGPDSWVLALERAIQNGERDVADILTREIGKLPTVQAAAAKRELGPDGKSTGPRVATAVQEAVTDLQIRIDEAMRTGRFDLANDLQGQIDQLLRGRTAPPTPAAAPRTMGPVPGAAPPPRPATQPEARDMGPITVTPAPGTVAGATPEEAVTAGGTEATQDLLDKARGEGSELPAESGVGIVGGDLRGAGAGGATTPVVPAPPIQPPPAGGAGTTQAFAPPPPMPAPPEEAPGGPPGAPPGVDPVTRNLANLAPWLRENARAAYDALTPGARRRLEELAAARKTAKQIAAELGLDVDSVRLVRVAMGIPSMTIEGPMGAGSTPNPDFEEWLARRQPSSPSPAPSTAPAPAAGPTVPDLLKALIRGAQTQEEAGALLSVAGRIQAAFGNNPPIEALDRLREEGLTPAEDDALSAFQLALAGGKPTQEEVDANIPAAPAAAAPEPPADTPPAPAAPPAAAEPTPEPTKIDRRNSVWAGRGTKGNVRVIFPDANHKELYVLGQRRTTESDFDQLRQRVQDLAKRFRVPEKDIGKMMTAYRQVVAQGIADLEEKAEWIAPPWTGGTGRVDWEPPVEPAPPAPPPAAGATPAAPPPAGEGVPVRGFVSRAPEGAGPGEKWVYREEDQDGKTVSEERFARKFDAEGRRKARGLELQRNRRQLRDKNLHPIEREVAARPPSSFPTHPDEPDTKLIPHPNSGEGTGWNLAIQKEFHQAWLTSDRPPAPLFKMLAAAKRLGAVVHPDWEKEFPGLDQVEAGTGQRGGALPRPAPATTAAPPAPTPPAGKKPLTKDQADFLLRLPMNSNRGLTQDEKDTLSHVALMEALRRRGLAETVDADVAGGENNYVLTPEGERMKATLSAGAPTAAAAPPAPAPSAGIEADYERLMAARRRNKLETIHIPPGTGPNFSTPESRAWSELLRSKGWTTHPIRSGEYHHVDIDGGRTSIEVSAATGKVTIFPSRAADGASILSDPDFTADAVEVLRAEEPETWEEAKQLLYETFNVYVPDADAKRLLATARQEALPDAPRIEDRRISDVPGVRVIYRSGMSRMGDLLGALNWDVPIGVDINELTGPAIEQIANAYAQGRTPHIFVDSGAYSAFKRGKAQDIEAVIALYRKLLDAIHAVDVNEEFLGTRTLYLTVPDVIANQKATLDLFSKYGPSVAGLSRNVKLVFPLQTGDLTLSEFRYRAAEEILGIINKTGEEDLFDRVVWGIPSNAAAAPIDQIKAFGDEIRFRAKANADEEGGWRKEAVHFLGAGSESTLRPLLDALGDGADVTADSNKLRALIGRSGSREQALQELLKTEGAPVVRRPIAQPDDPNAQDPPAGWVRTATKQKKDGSRVESFAGADGLAVDVTIGPEGEITVDGEPHDSLEAALTAAEGGESAETPPEPEGEVELGPRSAAALERWLKARKIPLDSEQGKEITRLVTRHRGVIRRLHAAEALVESIRLAKPLSIRGAKAVLKRRLQAAKTALKVETDNYEASTKALRGAVSAIPDAPWRSLIQIADGRLPEPRRARGPVGALLPRTLEFLRGLQDAPIEHPINFDTLEERVVEYAKTAVVSEAALISGIERSLSRVKPDEWKKMFAADLQGVGDKTVQEALTTGASHPAWKKIIAHQMRVTAERRAIEEALAEDGWPLVTSDLAGHVGTVAAAMGAEIEALPSTADPELPWGLTDPATGQPVRARAAHAAMTSRTGRLYARIVQALEDSLGGETVDQADEVPFDIPDGNPDDIPPFEAGDDATDGYLRAVSVPRPGAEAPERLLKLLGFRTEEDKPTPRPSILNMPLGKPLIRAAQQTLDFGPPRVHTPVREPRPAAGGQPVPAGPSAGGRGGAATGRAEPPDAGVRGPGARAPVGGAGTGGGGGAPQPTGGVVQAVQRGDELFKIVTIRPNFTFELPVRRELVPARLLKHLDDHQQVGAARAIEAMSTDERGFLLADGTGVGKTREILAVAEHFSKQGRSVLIVAPAAVLNIPKSGEGKGQATGSYADDSRTMGVAYEQIRLTGKTDKGPELKAGKIYLTHYESFFYKNQVDDNTVVIFDEAHNIKNPPDMSRRGGEGQKFAAKAHAVMFATATPGDQAHHLMYAQRIGLLEGRDERQFLADMGMVQQTRMGKDGQTFTVWKARDETVMRRAIKELYGRLTKAGKMIRREVDFSPVEVEFRDLTVSDERLAEIEKIHAAFPSESAYDTRMYLMHARRQLEPDKIQATLDIMDRELAAGRSVVIFSQRLNRSDVIKRTKYRDEEGRSQVLEELITSSEGTIKTLRAALAARGLAYAEITGDFAGRKDDQIQLFQSGKARVAIATVEGGGTGINLDDRLGTRPRTLVMMTAPLESTVYIQAIGRVHRKPTKSISRVIGLFSEHEVDTWNKQIIADKLQLQGAQVAGSVTRLDPTRGGDVDVDFGEDPEVLRPGTRRKPTDDGKTKPAAAVDLATALSTLKKLVTWNGRYQNPKRLYKESAYRIHRRTVVDELGGVVDVGGEWYIETQDGWVVRGRLTHPNERMGTYGTFSFDEGAKQGVPSQFGVETDDPEIKLVRDVDKLIETVAEYKTWRNFHRDHRSVLDQLFGVDAPLFARLLGATSQRAGVETNITLALRAYEQLRMGLPFRGFQPQVIGNLESIRQDEAISGTKVSPYTRALLGDEDATWVDRHIARLVLGREALGGEGQDRVSPRQERLVRAALRQAAEELGWTPAQMSSASWVAGQVLEGGVKEENVRDYARSLQARAAAIRRFYDYFGPVAGPGRRAVSAVAATPSDPRNLGFGTTAGDPEPEHRLTVATQVEGARAVETALQPLPTPHAVAIGTGFTAQDDESWNLWWTALSANFADGAGRWTIHWSDYAGMDVSTPAHIASIANIARNVAVEQSSVVLVQGGKLHGSLLSGSGTPGSTAPLPEGWTLTDLQLLMTRTGADGYYLVHNHPDGISRPSHADIDATVEIAARVPGFMGHVIVNHGTYQIITPAHIRELVAPARGARARGREAVREKLYTKLQEEFANSVGAYRGADPMLAQGISPEDYWRSDRYMVKGVDPLVQKFNGLLQSLSRGSKTAKWPLIVLVDNKWRLRAVTSVNPEIYFNKEAFKAWLDARKRDFGAHHAFVAIEQTVGGTEIVGLGAPEGWGESNRTATFDDTTRDYVWTTVLMGAVDPEAAAAQKTKATLENTIATRFDLRAFRFGTEPDTGGMPPPPGPPRPPGDDPNDPGWRRRVDFADARARAAGGRWTVSRLMDAFIAGVDRFLRGLRDFGRWAASMNYAGLGPYLRAMWARLEEMFRPRAYTVEGRPRSLADQPIEDMIPGPGGRTVIRPIPRVRQEDLDAALNRAAEGRREVPRIAPARGPTGQPGERPPAPPGSPINLDRIEDQDDVKNLMRQVMEALRARFQQVKSYRSWDEARDRAEAAGLTEQDVARLLREKGVLTDVEIEAIRMLRQEAMVDAAQKLAYVQDVQARLATATDAERPALEEELLEAQRNYRAAMHRGIGIMFTTVAAGSEAGRALAIHRRMIESLSPGERFMRRLLRGVPEDERFARELADAILRNDMREVMRLYHRVHRPTFWGYFNEYFINSILSGPATLIANIAGNVTHEALLRTPERGISTFLEERGVRAMIERFFGVAEPEGPQRVSGEMREAAKALLKLRMGFPDMWREFRLALTEENIPLYSQGDWSPPAWPGRLGTIIRTPGRVMKALDVASKKSAAAAERAARVYRMAVADVRSGRVQESELTNRVLEIDEQLQNWLQLDRQRQVNPRLLTTEDRNFLTRNRHLAAVVKAMIAAADRSTFQDDVLPLTRMLMTARARHPWLTPFVPFIKTPERILVAAVKRTPLGLVQALNAMRTGQLKGGEASDRIAEGVLGTTTAIVFYMMAKEGLLTGGGPSDPKERQVWLATGKLPYAIRIGKTWYSLARIEPLATTLGFAADLAEAQDARTQGDAWDKLHYSILNNITNKTYLEGMINAAEALSDPDRYGAQFSKRMVGALVPNLLASAARAIDPTIRQTDDISSTIIARLPIMSETLPAKLTGTGEARLRGETMLSRFASPIRYSDEGGPERNLERLFLETGYSPSAPPRAVRLPGAGGREFILNAEERQIYGDYARRATGFARELARYGDWTRLDVYQKEEVLKRIYRFAHDAARRDIYRSVYRRAWAGQAEEKAR